MGWGTKTIRGETEYLCCVIRVQSVIWGWPCCKLKMESGRNDLVEDIIQLALLDSDLDDLDLVVGIRGVGGEETTCVGRRGRSDVYSEFGGEGVEW